MHKRLVITLGIVLALGVVALALFSPMFAAANNPVVVIETSMGPIKVELNQEKAPISVRNFLQYVDDKHYDGTIFHRVTNRPPVIQGGGYEPGKKEKKTRDPIKNESANGLSNSRASVAMARTGDPNSATSQFYINTKDNDFLDKKNDPQGHGYCVFGKVIEGMDVVDKIAKVETAPGDVPRVDVMIKSIKRVDK